MKLYQVESYVTEDGEAPIQLRLEQLKDRTAQTKIYTRLDRASYGNFGDWKKLKDVKEIFEMREHYGQGYRLYYTIVGQTIVLLLAGSSKQDQNRAIAKASHYLADYKRRAKP